MSKKTFQFLSILIFLFLIFAFGKISVLSGNILHNAALVIQNQQKTIDVVDNYLSSISSTKLLELSVTISPHHEQSLRRLGFNYIEIGCKECALEAWQHISGMEKELLQWAIIQDRVNMYEDAFNTYDYILSLTPDWSDAWYHLGLLNKQERQWDDALFALETAINSQNFDSSLLSDTYFQKGQIYQYVAAYKNIDLALQNYDMALEEDSFSHASVKAQAFYERGVIYEWQQRAPVLILEQYQNALILNPEHDWARLRMGYQLYWANKDFDLALAEINQVLEFWQSRNSPHLKWPYRYLGDIYQDAHRTADAITAYETAMALDPTDEYIIEMLAKLRHE